MRDDHLALEWMYGEHPEGIRYRPQHERSANLVMKLCVSTTHSMPVSKEG